MIVPYYKPFIIFLLFLILIPLNLKAKTYNAAISEEKVKTYINQCAIWPSPEDIEKELRNSFEKEERVSIRNQEMKWTSLLEDPHIKHIDIDGFQMERVSPRELEILLELTTHEFSSPLWNPGYSITEEVQGEVLIIRRQCLREICQKRAEEGLSYIYDLHLVENIKPFCKDILCASQRIFGNPRGIYLLYAQHKYGIRLSRYSHVNADPEGFKLNELKSILMALDTIPNSIQDRDYILRYRSFFRFLKGYSNKNNGPSIMANASGSVFDLFTEIGEFKQFYVIVHEIGHRAGYREYPESEKHIDLSKSEEWLTISGFYNINKGNKLIKDYEKLSFRTSISSYGDTSPIEDFAESYVMYRLDPQQMKSKFPQRYDFMRDYIFDRREYTEDLCQGIRSLPLELSSSSAEEREIQNSVVIPRDAYLSL